MRAARPLRSLAVLVTVAGAVAGLAASPATAATSTTTLGPGVTLTRQSLTLGGHSQRVWYVTTRFSAATRLVFATPQHVIGAPAMTTAALGDQEHALAGVDGDTFYFADPSAVPRGGVMNGGYTLKSPLIGQNAVLYLTADGEAHIGDVGSVGTMSIGGRSPVHVPTTNSLETARNGSFTFTDHNMLSRAMPTCSTVVLGATATAHRYTVLRYLRDVRRYTRVASGQHAIVTCGASSKAYLDARTRVGEQVQVAFTYRGPTITALISGVRKLVSAGRAWNDPTGLDVYGDQHKPETFVCVPRGGRGVTFGVFEGSKPGAFGVTYRELTTWLVGHHCDSAMAAEGSTSAQLVARRAGHPLQTVNRITGVHGRPRPQVDGIYVVRT